ncbi:molybdopterin molybdotransferase [Propionibacterium cyclohexanicum]|uniref:Molybdopterin molybdenumtransferase n=1 Tax=Propionibacterium cyclohexanicum TaxID=64702 RepID=A0A1H9U2C4_9ACTN|nr:gephyrin-like molybdotransferase Glp [Propionibacterium cyclohexanicum]SES03314.1 molybdopterin molybdotransferase [Propionibacterium cyclohexanicum]
MNALLEIAEHRALVEAVARPLPTVPRRLLGEVGSTEPNCFGTILAEPLEALLPVPPFTNSAMDGFAVRHADIAAASESEPVRLPVAGDIAAGDTAEHEVEPGTAWRIMTGALLPRGADTVVRVEHTDHQGSIRELPATVGIRKAPKQGANVRQRGEDVSVGTVVLKAGRLLDAAALACAVSVGHGQARIHPRPQVGIITTGDELVSPGDRPRPGQVPDSNGIMLTALVAQAGGTLVVRTRAKDDPDALRARLETWPQVDLIVTAGGISEGAYEVVRQAFTSPTMRFHHVRQQPGGPQGVGTFEVHGRQIPVLCLPGNPVSAFVCFHLYVAGAIGMMATRRTDSRPRRHDVVVSAGWSSPVGKTQFTPVSLLASTVAPVHRLVSGSHLIASLPQADGLAIVPAGIDHVSPGDHLRFINTREGNLSD